jgi:PAS domain S-box-containing protein
VHPADIDEITRVSTLTAAHPAPFTLEYRLRRHDGQYRFVLDQARPIVETGTVRGYVGTVTDVTDQKTAAAAQSYLEAILESADDAIISKDLNGVIQWSNAAAERVFGYTSSEMVGRSVRMLIPADRQAEEDDILARIRRGERVDHFETVRVRKDGTPIDISLTISPVRDAAGSIIGVSKIARDITAQKRASEERDRLLDAERAARADAERASRVKDEFVAMVSHELRTPLNAILGWTQLMLRIRQDPGTIERGLDIVARNTRLQAQLISNLLDISRIVSGKLQLEMERVDLRQAVTQAIETIRQEAQTTGIAIHEDLGHSAATTAGDPSRLQQVLWNLLTNAVKFTAPGGRIDVSLFRHPESTEIRVTDNGAGIRAEVLPHIFDRFHQADRSITRRFGGLGLGLSIVKHIIEMHGGQVYAESAGEGQGATFTIQLPASAPEASEESASQAAAHEWVSLDGLNILVVEDEPDTREFVRRLLETHGAQVWRATSAGEALEAFRTDWPDILISDVGLPDVDGYDLVQRIRHDPSLHGNRTPAIALTAYSRAEDRTRALRAGYQAHLAKPVESSELLASIASFGGLVPQDDDVRRP